FADAAGDGAAAEKGGRSVVGMAFEVGDDFEERLGGEIGAGELVQAGNNAGAQRSTGAEAAGDWDVAGDGCVEMDSADFGAAEEELGGLGDDGLGGSFGASARERDLVV